MSTCRAEYARQGGRDPGDRIVRCHLATDHPGDHQEADTEVTWPAPEVIAQAPAALINGTFALYDDGRGGYVLVIDTPATGVDRRHIPARMVKLAAKFMGGNPLSRIGG